MELLKNSPEPIGYDRKETVLDALENSEGAVLLTKRDGKGMVWVHYMSSFDIVTSVMQLAKKSPRVELLLKMAFK